MMQTVLQDMRYGLRMLRKSPGFTIAAVLSLGLVIGANTAVFSLIDTVMLRMLPVPNPGQLVEFLHRYPGEPRLNGFSWESYEHFRDHNHVFSGVIGFGDARFSVRGEGLSPEIVDGEYVVGDFFPILGVKPAIGRLIGPKDEQMDAAGSAVAVLGWAYWQSRFNLDRAIVGKQIVVGDAPVTIIGVTPREFVGLQIGSRSDIWLPAAMAPIVERSNRTSSGRIGLNLVGRLKRDVSLEQARAEMSVLFRFTLEEMVRKNKDPLWRQETFEVEPAGAGLSRLRDRYAKPLLLIMGVVGLLLLITCTSVASMLLARGAARQYEMALRVSLGATPLRLLQQVLTESLLLSVTGSLLAVFLAYLGVNGLLRMMSGGGSPQIELHAYPDLHVFLFTAGIALFTGVLFGLAPAWNAYAYAPTSSLREIARVGETRFQRLFGKGLVIAQVAFSVTLLSAAGLFVGHLWKLQHIDLGFRRDHVLLVTLDPKRGGYKGEQLSRAYQELLGHLEAIPGVRSATLSAMTPLSGAGAARFVTAEGYQEKPEDRRYVSLNWVAPKYFETLGVPFLAGRDFNLQDQGQTRAAIVNQATARYYFADGNPIGKHINLDGDANPYEIIGVVGDARYSQIREVTRRQIYFDAFQLGNVPSQFLLRTNIDPAAVAPDVRRAVSESLKTVPVSLTRTLADQVDASILPERLIAMLSGLLGAIGALLAAIGLYGLLSYTVARRINEIGVRMALGATQNDVIKMVLGDALGLVAAGVVIGTPMVLWGKSATAHLIQDLSPSSAIPMAFGVLGMITVALLAAYIPARRAARVDPIGALRYE